VVPCDDGTKDKDRVESCDPLSPLRVLEPRLDGPDESARFTSLHSTQQLLHPTQHLQQQHTTTST
jgi:hypothetical protein